MSLKRIRAGAIENEVKYRAMVTEMYDQVLGVGKRPAAHELINGDEFAFGQGVFLSCFCLTAVSGSVLILLVRTFLVRCARKPHAVHAASAFRA